MMFESGEADQREAREATDPAAPLGWKLWKSLRFGALHCQSGFGIGLGLFEAIQFRPRDAWPQIALAAG